MNPVIKVQNVNKSFRVGSQDVQILKDISFEIKQGDFSIIFGPSGCGKSTLLYALLGLECPTTGLVTLLDTNLYALASEDDRSEFRKNHIGMVYQQPNWIKSLTVLENIAFPLLLKGEETLQARTKAQELLKTIQMESWGDYLPSELSSGQQQRIALIRSLVTNPELIIADEPTGNLDFESGQALMQLLQKLNTDEKKTIVMVTHDLEYLKYAKTAIKMFNGEVVGIYTEENKSELMSHVRSKRGLSETQMSSE